METKWLEDFVSLADTRSFSRSAQLRHVTQPAFSRRIQSLEMVQGLQLTRAMLRGHTSAGRPLVAKAAPCNTAGKLLDLVQESRLSKLH
jgi:DNA-binding transcriptional LysR family regulator